MAIIDYEHKARKSEEWFFNKPDVSKENKEQVKRFLAQYDVSPARINIFLRHIYFLLSRTTDIKAVLEDKDQVNQIFKEIRDTIKDGYYSTVINVSLRFARWLNDGDKPKGFKDIQNLSKKKQKRNLKPNDMVSWEDGLKLIKQTNSVQIKAVLMTQLDGGLRPSEFVELDYGDCEVKKNFIIVTIKDGKTGSRLITLYKAVPYLLRWLQAHPTKKKNDPLWAQEGNNQGKVIRYDYFALRKRIKQLFEKARIDKPYDFYNLRHSACVLSKLDNVPEELAAEKFGHSIEYYTSTYGRLSTEDKMKRYSKIYGLKEEKIKVENNVTCSRCGFVNEPENEFCSKCVAPLSLGKALEVEKSKEEEIHKLQSQMQTMGKNFDKINTFMNQLSKNNPEVIDILAGKGKK
jgi:integrase